MPADRLGILTYSRPPSWAVGYMAKTILFRVGPRSHAAYAALHNYTVLTPTACQASALIETISPAEWVKIFLALACMRVHPHLEWLLWVDSDAVFANTLTSIEDHFALEDPRVAAHCSLMLPSDWKHEDRGINTGVLLLRNDLFAARVLRRLVNVYSTPDRKKRFPEQRALSFLLGHEDSPSGAQSRAFLRNAPASYNLTIWQLPNGSAACIARGELRRSFFSMVEPSTRYHTWNGIHTYNPTAEHEYRTGDFIAHFSGGTPPFPPISLSFVRAWMSRLGLRAFWNEEEAAFTRELREATVSKAAKPKARAPATTTLSATSRSYRRY
jgi:hypothetical protein